MDQKNHFNNNHFNDYGILTNLFNQFSNYLKSLDFTIIDIVIKSIVPKFIYFFELIGSEIFSKKTALCDNNPEKLGKISEYTKQYTNMVDSYFDIFLQFFNNNQFKIICIVGSAIGLLCLYCVTKIVLLKYFNDLVYNNKILN